jgi:hypothetical protein
MLIQAKFLDYTERMMDGQLWLSYQSLLEWQQCSLRFLVAKTKKLTWV